MDLRSKAAQRRKRGLCRPWVAGAAIPEGEGCLGPRAGLAGLTAVCALSYPRAASLNTAVLPPPSSHSRTLTRSLQVLGMQREQTTARSLTWVPAASLAPAALAGPTQQIEHERALALIFFLHHGYKGRAFLNAKPKGIS